MKYLKFLFSKMLMEYMHEQIFVMGGVQIKNVEYYSYNSALYPGEIILV